MRDLLRDLLKRIDDGTLSETSVIPWAQPVLSFGDIKNSKVATLGLNPSNREFVSASGAELVGQDRRFQTLDSLGLTRWSEAKDSQIDLMINACTNYFRGNPYDAWFHALETLFSGAGVSYYGMFSSACHLDLVPFATETKWGELSTKNKMQLMEITGDVLAHLVKDSNIEVIILNGKSVIESLQEASNTTLNKQVMPSWSLPRKGSLGVKGVSYTGEISMISGIPLNRKISILGFNHNIQSSFGVTTKVKTGIKDWITQSANEVFC